uniref:HSF-type DNA-binding domain-containing protein n=1 Tax=Stomoxys calcitrans TaxID=35570 RepID=A0A1I8PIV1_STOCA
MEGNFASYSFSLSEDTYITCQDIIHFPFPYKLWLLVNLETYELLRWNLDGTVILLDLVSLDDYLASNKSIFKIKNRSVFLQHLKDFKFERLNVDSEPEEDVVLQYKHEYFQRHRMYLLANIRLHAYQHMDGSLGQKDNQVCRNTSAAAVGDARHNKAVWKRMMGDLCGLIHGGLSRIQKSRLCFNTTVRFKSEKRHWSDILKVLEENANLNQSFLAETALREREFEYPQDSNIYIANFIRPEYAGYYGNSEISILNDFFKDLLPKYANDGSLESKQLIENISKWRNGVSQTNINFIHSSFDISSINGHFEIQVELGPAQAGEFQTTLQNEAYSSMLEPIYKTDEELENDFMEKTYNMETTSENPHDKENDEVIVQEFIEEPLLTEDSLNSNNINEIQETSTNQVIEPISDTYMNICENIQLKNKSHANSMEEFVKIQEPMVTDDCQNNINEVFQQIESEASSLENFLYANNVIHNGFEESQDNSEGQASFSAEETYANMPANVKLEIESESNINDSNFRSFFGQYRASFNVLHREHI